MNHTRLMASIAAASVLLSATAMAQADPKKVERAWKSKCASCHGQTGKGDTDQGKQMKIGDLTAPAAQAKSDADFKKAILDGAKTPNGAMPPFKGDVTPEQADALVAYIRSLKK